MSDIPTPIAEGIWNKYSGEGAEYSYELYEALQLIEQRLAIAVAALEWYAGTNNGNMDFARDTLTQIEEKK